MQVQILDEAEQDLLEGAQFYENQIAGLGQYFLDSLFSDIDSLQIYGGIHSVHFGYHRLLSKRFPFAIYYRVENNVAHVTAILDFRQDPERVRKRLN
ncbi:MAG: hypothetical protein A2Z25_08960 [Planctomycetes bacterium RBG_16_55_9]|nr:MAG: hypothetical protein A2Z25_08960 [Planctomycetes bacterium RBG_16_55_9]